MDIVNIYSDGSYTSTNAVWAFICFDLDGKEIFKNRGMLKGKINSMHQVGGELYGVMEALRYCKANNYKANLFVDYTGLINWVADIVGAGRPWKCKNEFTNEYRNFIIEYKQYINSINLVKGHAGIAGNEAVDGYASALWNKKNENNN